MEGAVSMEQGQADSRSGDDARTLFLDAAEELIAHHGFNGTSTTSTAESAGVAKGLLFYYFPSKSDLLVALMAERLPATGSDVDLLAMPGDPAAELISTLKALNLADHKSAVPRMILGREASTQPKGRLQLRSFQKYLEHDIAAVLVKCLPEPTDVERIRTSAATWVSAFFFSAIDDRLSDLDGLSRRGRDQLKAIATMLASSLHGPDTALAFSPQQWHDAST